MYKELINRLIEHKRKNGLSWIVLAEKTGVSYSLLTKMAVGIKDNPTAKTMQMIDEYLQREDIAA